MTTSTRSPAQGSAAWRDWRRGGYGASDAPTLVLGDEEAWRRLHAEKLGLIPDPEATEPMHWGLLLEDVVAKRYEEETGERVERRRLLIEHPELSMVRASLDRRRKRDRVIVEIKVYGWRTDEFGADGSDQVPERMWYQVQQQLAASGWDQADLAVYFGASRTKRLGIFRIGRDGVAIEELLALEQETWAFVARGEMPPWPGPTPERVKLKADEIPADDGLIELVYEHDIRKVQADVALANLDEVKDALRTRLVEVGGTRGALPDGRTFTVSHRQNKDGSQTGWEDVARGYRRRLLELGVPESELDLPVTALTVTKPGARPLVVRIKQENTSADT